MIWKTYKSESYEDNRYIKIFYTTKENELRKIKACYYYLELIHMIKALSKEYRNFEVYYLQEDDIRG